MIKRCLYLLLLVGSVFSCSSEGSDPVLEPEEENRAPSIPVIVYPLNNTLCINNTISFEWNSSIDPDGDNVAYKIEISRDANFSSILTSKPVSNATSALITLDKGLYFFWRVKAIDKRNAESNYSSTGQFLTEADGVSNHLPFVADLVAPEIDEVINGTSAVLSWTASDIDNDALTFDVYLDTATNPVIKVSENQTETTFNATGLSAATTYYFKVNVKDDNGGVTLGRVWSFKTQ